MVLDRSQRSARTDHRWRERHWPRCAVQLSELGADVVITYRDGAGARRGAAGVGGEHVTLDLSRLEAIATLGVDVNIVVNNAGLQHVEAARPGVTSDPTNSGYVRTALVEQQTADQAELHEMSPKRVVSDVLMERSALERLSDPNEVASLAGYLRSPPAGAITGASLVVAGRWPAQ